MAAVKTNTFGELLRSWRLTRRASQLELGMEAGVSARHISFIETGRANPSQEMVIILATVLDVPLRERNLLLHAAGYMRRKAETISDYFSSLARYFGIGDCARQPLIHRNNNIL